MPSLSMSVEHALGADEALGRVKELLGNAKVQFSGKITGLRENWNGNQGEFEFTVMNNRITGTLCVTGSSVVVKGSLPFVAGLFMGKIESVIRREALKFLC